MNILKVFETYTCKGNRCDKMALRTTLHQICQKQGQVVSM